MHSVTTKADTVVSAMIDACAGLVRKRMPPRIVWYDHMKGLGNHGLIPQSLTLTKYHQHTPRDMRRHHKRECVVVMDRAGNRALHWPSGWRWMRAVRSLSALQVACESV